MSTLNQITLIGNVGRDPESFVTRNGDGAKFSLATKGRGKDGKTSWHSVVCFGRAAEFVLKHVRKGSKLLVSGRLDYDEWQDKETGRKRTRAKVVTWDVSFFGAAKKEDGEEWRPPNKGAAAARKAVFEDEDDLPF